MILVCSPKNFYIDKPINLTEEKYFANNDVSTQKLINEYNNLIKCFKKYKLNYHELTDYKNCPEQVFVRDVGFQIADKHFLSTMKCPVRKREVPALKQFYEQNKIDYYTFDGTIEGGDVIEGSNIVFVGVGNRTSKKAIEQLKGYTNKQVVPIRLANDSLHLDCAFNVIDEKNAIVVQDCVNAKDLELLKSLFTIHTVPFTEHNAYSTNFLRVMVGSEPLYITGSEQARKIIKSLGYKVAFVKTLELEKLGGSIRCITYEVLHKNVK